MMAPGDYHFVWITLGFVVYLLLVFIFWAIIHGGTREAPPKILDTGAVSEAKSLP